MTKPVWIAGSGTISAMDAIDSATTKHFFDTPSSFCIGDSLDSNPAPPNYHATPVLFYTSYAKFVSDVQSNSVTYPYKWVYYDPEDWDVALTPVKEQQNPWYYLNRFGYFANSHGFKSIAAPAMDLAWVHGSLHPITAGQAGADWWTQHNLAGAAAPDNTVLQLQVESLESASTYVSFFESAAAQARAANPDILIGAEISTRNGTVAQMVAAAKSISPYLFYLAAPADASDAVAVLKALKNAGY